jgi:hypothetical protein
MGILIHTNSGWRPDGGLRFRRVSPPNAPVHAAGFGLQPFNLSITKSANTLWRRILRIAVSRDPQLPSATSAISSTIANKPYAS